MNGVRIHENNANKWINGRDFGTQKSGMGFNAEELAQFEDDKLDSPVRMHEIGDAKTLQLFESIMQPNILAEIHSHATDEIMYVLKGSMVLGNRTLGPGSSVFFAADTLYSFRSGPDGLHFLNFRPTKDEVYRSREQHLAYVKQKKQAKEAAE